MTDNFYVYEHWRTDRDECFYVGKGKASRAYKMRDRNRFHSAITAKLSREGHAVEVKIVACGLTEESAFSLEVERIEFWRAAKADLANSKSGGRFGGAGNPAWNRKKVICLTDGRIFNSASEAAKVTKINLACITESCRDGKPASGLHFSYGVKNFKDEFSRKTEIDRRKKYAVSMRKKVVNPYSPNEIINGGVDKNGRKATGPMKISRKVICVDDGKEYPSASAAASHYRIPKSSVIMVCLKKPKRLTAGGFRFEYIGDEK